MLFSLPLLPKALAQYVPVVATTVYDIAQTSSAESVTETPLLVSRLSSPFAVSTRLVFEMLIPARLARLGPPPAQGCENFLRSAISCPYRQHFLFCRILRLG